MVRFLLLIAVLCFAGCGEGKPYVPKGSIDGQVKAATARIAASEGRYVDEANLPDKFKAAEFPRIIIDDVKLWLDPNMPGWEESGGGYRSVQFNCPVAWMEIGSDRILSDGTDFRSDDESLYGIGKMANVDGDLMVRHREGLLQIMDGGKWRTVRPGDQLRPAAVESLITDTDSIRQRIGTSDVWAFNSAAGWLICEEPVSSLDVKHHRPVEFIDPSRLVVTTYDPPVAEPEHEADSDSGAIRLAAVQAEFEEALSQLVAINDQVREKSLELTALLKLKKLTSENLTNLRNEVERLTDEQRAADKAKQEAEAVRDNSISQNWRDDVYAPGLVTPTGDR